jgi:lipoprotein-anchoring transpeptidase ErfK/SrfK
MLRLTLRAAAVAAGTTVLIGVTPAISFADPATITAVSPGYGPVGTVVDVTGSGLSTATDVTFHGVEADPPVVVDDTHIQVTVPSGATTGRLVVTTADGAPYERYVVQVPTSASTSRSRATVVYPHESTIRAHLTAAGVAVRGQEGRLQRTRPHTSAWRNVQDPQTTNRQGGVHWTVRPAENFSYRVVFKEVPAYYGTHSPRTRVNVRPLVELRAPAITPTLTSFTLHGRVRPQSAHHGQVVLGQRIDGVWHRIAAQRLADGRFSFPQSLPDTGRYAYRVRRPHDAHHRSGQSTVAVVHAEQRTLRSGMSGPDVRMLQQRLRHLHYDVGRVTSDFGYDTLHAVVAFQKVQGISRDGVVGPDVWKRLGTPRVPHLRHPEAAYPTGVEVDITKQVVYYAVDGKIRRILDASSGGGYTYTGSDGTQQQAITPTGHYSVIRKYDGWETAPLGQLYRPAYFRSDGYAIHGSNSVPNYPASHGCVRITVPAADRMWNRFVYGMSVWLYRS